MQQETFFTLLQDPAHWMFEIFLMLIFDVLIGLIIWPLLWKKILHHQSDDQKIEVLEKKVKALEDKLDFKSINRK